ncbi:GUN4 domain-containing protein [Synechocystis sp. LKSZ1]|uniref:GUN4 domain-containing protein n=1 Tax=Synechocystis sp. LKSZ1 TaxID=3144951 RepID=UPI00336BDC18
MIQYVAVFLLGVLISSIILVIWQNQKLNTLKTKYEIRLKSELEKAQDKFNKQLANVQNSHQLEKQNLVKQYETKIEKANQAHQEEIRKKEIIIQSKELAEVWTSQTEINPLTQKYKPLIQALHNREWEKADQETAHLIFKDCGAKNAYLEISELQSIPVETLFLINELWLYFSQGHFGFSAQKQVLDQVGNSSKLNSEEWRQLGDYLGWRKNNTWLSNYSQLIQSLDAPRGQFPFLLLWKGTFWGEFIDSQSMRFITLMQRFSDSMLKTSISSSKEN